MTRTYRITLTAGVLAVGILPAVASADETKPPSPPAPAPGAPAGAPEAPAAKPAEGAQKAPPAAGDREDERDRKIRILTEKLDEALRRIEQLEKERKPEPGKEPVTPPDTQTPPPDTPPDTPPPAPQPPSGGGGATFLPNISIVGNLIFGAGDTRRVPNRGRFNFDEFELALQDQVAPKLRYDIFLSAAKGEDWKLGLEEGYLTATALMKGLNARVGRIRNSFGKFNRLHPHQWPFITQPSVVGAFMGEEGLVSDGAVLEYLLPTKGFFAQADLGWWQNTSEAEDGLGFGAGENGAYSGRLWLGKELGRNKELELGFSRYQGRGGVLGFGNFRKALNGVDLTYRAYPKTGRRLMASAELMHHHTSIFGSSEDRLGGFAYLAYRMNPFWEAGARVDYTRFPYGVNGYDAAGSLFLTKYLTEQTSLRLEYQYSKGPVLGTGSGIYFQILFGSGPHTHPLQ